MYLQNSGYCGYRGYPVQNSALGISVFILSSDRIRCFYPRFVQFLFTVARFLRRPPGPEFRGISRESGPRSPASGFQRFDPPLGHTLLHGKAEKLTREVGLVSPKAVPQRGGGRRTAGRFRRRAGQPSGVRAAHGGKNGRKRGKKPHTRAFSGFRGWARTGLRGGSRGFFRGAPGESRAAPGQNGAVGRPSGAGTASVGGEKPPFAAKRAGNGAVAGRKLAEKAGGVCRVIWRLQGIFGRFRRKIWGFEKAFPRAYRKDLPFAPFLCRWRTVIGGDNLVVRSGCFFCLAE